MGPFEPSDMKVQVSRFGVIPKKEKKKHQPRKWRLILDLSHPESHSVNTGISCELYSLTYLRRDDVAEAIITFGQGAQLAKVDVASAYRIVAANPADRHLLGVRWKDKIYVDAALSFGLRSAPNILTALADALNWGLKSLGIRYLDQYLDDWITVGSPETKDNCDVISATFERLGGLLAHDKTEGSIPCFEYLDITIHTIALDPMSLQRSKA